MQDFMIMFSRTQLITPFKEKSGKKRDQIRYKLLPYPSYFFRIWRKYSDILIAANTYLTQFSKSPFFLESIKRGFSTM